MARKYKRSSNGRFAGGGGTAGTGTKVSAGRGKPSVTGSQKRVVARKGSAAAKQSKTTTPSNQRLQGARKAAKQVGKFAAKNPRLVVGVAGLAAANIAGRSSQKGLQKMAEAMAKAQKYAEGQAADKRGIGGSPSAGLKRSSRNLRGSYKIRSS